MADDRVGERARYLEALMPVERGHDRHDDVETDAARRLHEALEAERGEHVAHGTRRRNHRGPAHVGSGVEVEDETVRVLDVIDGRVPGMDLEHVHLHQREDPGEVVGDEVLAELRLLLDAHATKSGRCPDARVLHEEARLADAARATDEGERSAGDVRHDPLRDAFVVGGDVALGEAEVGIENALRVREPDRW